MKKILGILLIISIVFSSFSFVAFAQDDETIYSFDFSDDICLYYYKDSNGDPYIIEDGEKYSIAVPDYVEKITDESLLAELRSGSNKISPYANDDILFSQIVYFNTLAKTGVLNVTEKYLFLKCSKLNPSNAERAFSYWIMYSNDNVEWMSAFYSNKSLTFYTRHPMASFGNAKYIKVHIYSYYGTVSSCLLSVKQGGVLG